VSGRCRQLGCQLAGVKFCHCFGREVVRPPSYVVWATPTHPSRPWAVGHELSNPQNKNSVRADAMIPNAVTPRRFASRIDREI
jgi:hypothetical protein